MFFLYFIGIEKANSDRRTGELQAIHAEAFPRNQNTQQ